MNACIRLTGLAAFALLTLSACRTYPDYAAAFHFPIEGGDIAQGRDAFVRLGCPQCHTVAGADLSDYTGQRFITMPLGGEVVFAESYGDLATSIINPDHVISDRYLDQLPREQRAEVTSTPMYMKLDMKVTELVDLVAFLNSRYVLLPDYTSYEEGEN